MRFHREAWQQVLRLGGEVPAAPCFSNAANFTCGGCACAGEFKDHGDKVTPSRSHCDKSVKNSLETLIFSRSYATLRCCAGQNVSTVRRSGGEIVLRDTCGPKLAETHPLAASALARGVRYQEAEGAADRSPLAVQQKQKVREILAQNVVTAGTITSARASQRMQALLVEYSNAHWTRTYICEYIDKKPLCEFALCHLAHPHSNRPCLTNRAYEKPVGQQALLAPC